MQGEASACKAPSGIYWAVSVGGLLASVPACWGWWWWVWEWTCCIRQADQSTVKSCRSSGSCCGVEGAGGVVKVLPVTQKVEPGPNGEPPLVMGVNLLDLILQFGKADLTYISLRCLSELYQRKKIKGCKFCEPDNCHLIRASLASCLAVDFRGI